MNGRWVFGGLALLALVLYILTYVCLSLNGVYRPATIGLNGVKSWDWSPAGYVDKEYRERRPVFVLFLPLWALDRAFWHSDALYGQRDPHINFRGMIIDASTPP